MGYDAVTTNAEYYRLEAELWLAQRGPARNPISWLRPRRSARLGDGQAARLGPAVPGDPLARLEETIPMVSPPDAAGGRPQVHPLGDGWSQRRGHPESTSILWNRVASTRSRKRCYSVRSS